MSTHNICFLGEIRRIASRLFSYLGLIEEPNTRVHCFVYVCWIIIYMLLGNRKDEEYNKLRLS